jgi:hypothetical protein
MILSRGLERRPRVTINNFTSVTSSLSASRITGNVPFRQLVKVKTDKKVLGVADYISTCRKRDST